MTNSGINEAYLRVAKSRERLQKLKKMDAPDIIINNEHRVFENAIGELMQDQDIAAFAEDIGPRAFAICFDHVAGVSVPSTDSAMHFAHFSDDR